MKHSDRPVDKHGFPIPQTFESAGLGSQASRDEASGIPRRGIGQRGKYVLVGMLAVVAVVLVLDSPLTTIARLATSEWLAEVAEHRISNDDVHGALTEMDWAIWFGHDRPELYFLRATWRLEAKDLAGALADSDRVISLDGGALKTLAGRKTGAQLDPIARRRLSWTYMHRSQVYQRLGDTKRALEDANEAVKTRLDSDAIPLNARAYARALAGVELKEALADVELALRMAGGDIPAFLDTRGLIQHLLGNQTEALTDLDLAIGRTEEERRVPLSAARRRVAPAGFLARRLRYYNETLAVMYHHRGMVYEKVGRKEEATADLRQGDKLGYNPAEGVY